MHGAKLHGFHMQLGSASMKIRTSDFNVAWHCVLVIVLIIQQTVLAVGVISCTIRSAVVKFKLNLFRRPRSKF